MVAAATALLMVFAFFITSVIVYARWNAQQFVADASPVIREPVPTPFLTPTPPEAIVVERSSSNKPVVTPPPSGSVTAQYVNAPFSADGDLAGWTEIPSYASTFSVASVGGWDESDDLQAFWRLAWDDINLYVAVLVVDDVHVQTQTGNLIYLGDSVELQIDTQRSADLGQPINRDDFQLILSPGDFDALQPSVVLLRGTDAGQLADEPSSGIVLSSAQLPTGYVLEAVVPWSSLDVRPYSGLELGLALNASDNDTPATAQQEVVKSHVAQRQLGQPSTWGLLILTGGNVEVD